MSALIWNKYFSLKISCFRNNRMEQPPHSSLNSRKRESTRYKKKKRPEIRWRDSRARVIRTGSVIFLNKKDDEMKLTTRLKADDTTGMSLFIFAGEKICHENVSLWMMKKSGVVAQENQIDTWWWTLEKKNW